MKTKKEIEEEFEKNQKQIFLLQQQLQALLNRQEQLKGQFELLTEIEQEKLENAKKRIKKSAE